MNYKILQNEINSDLLARGYSGMTDQQIADSVNTLDRSRNKTSITGSEMFGATKESEYATLSDIKKDQWLSLCAIETIDPFGPAVEVVKNIWGGGSATVTNLATLRTEFISRASELLLGKITDSDVATARAL